MMKHYCYPRNEKTRTCPKMLMGGDEALGVVHRDPKIRPNF